MASIINALSSGTGGIVTSGDASGILQLQTANTAAVTIDGSQNVGIGTSSSSYKLEVSSASGSPTVARLSGGTTSTSDNTQLRFYGKGSATNLYAIGTDIADGGTGANFDFFDLVANTNRMRIDSSGNVGIGTSSPNVDGYNADNTVLTIKGKSAPGTSQLELQAFGTTVNDQALGQITFLDGTTRNALIAGIRATSTSTAYLGFYTSSGSGVSERMRISSGGIVTKPNNPAFVALGSGGSTSYGSGAEFILANAVTNIGSHYSTSTGRFTAPVAGFYSFTYAIYSYAGSAQQIAFKKNGSDYAPGTDTEGLNSVVPNYISGTSFMVYLAANDTASFGWRNGNSANIYHGHSWFSGHLVG